MRYRRRRNPDMDTLLMVGALLVGGYFAYEYVIKPKQLPPGPGSNPPPNGLTYEQACAQARAWMATQDDSWANAACQQIVDHLRTNTSIFGRDIRGPLGL